MPMMVQRGMMVVGHVVVMVTMICVGRQRRHLAVGDRVVVIGACQRINVCMANILSIADGHLFALVPGQFDGTSDIFSDDALVSALVQQGVNRLYLIPAYNM